MTAVAGIDDADMRGNIFGNKVCCTAVCMPDNKHVNVHGFQIAQCVQQGLTLGGAGLGDIDIQYVSRQALGGQFKCGACACAGLEKQIYNRFAAQQGYFFYSLFSDAGK